MGFNGGAMQRQRLGITYLRGSMLKVFAIVTTRGYAFCADYCAPDWLRSGPGELAPLLIVSIGPPGQKRDNEQDG